jgi:hypothetical protein
MAERISVDFGSLSDNKLWVRGSAVAQALDRSTKYSKPPVNAADLKSQVDAFHGAIVAVKGPDQGSKMGIATRDSLRAQLIVTLKLIAPYMQANCDGDLSDSGFETVGSKRKSPQPVATPRFRWIKHGSHSGWILLMIGGVDDARGYEVQYAALQEGIPGPWTCVAVMNIKSAYTVSGLTPATIYAFQVRALGVVNKSDWSDSVTLMCV